MKIERVYCDRCETPIEEGAPMVRVLMQRVKVRTRPTRGRAPKPETTETDLCPACASDVVDGALGEALAHA